MVDKALPAGVRYLPRFLDAQAQRDLLALIRDICRDAPLFTPVMPRTGKPFSVRMTNCGPLGWVSDRDGYRYQALHPQTGRPWPPIPAPLLDLWSGLADFPAPPEACLINWYGEGARMGLHRDSDEAEFAAPVLSVSLGDDARFRIGGVERKGPTLPLRLMSGDVLLMGNESRLAFHGIDSLYPGTSTLLDHGGRINLTLRRVNPA